MKRTIVALGAIALALALAGGAWAGKKYIITSSSQVKPHSISYNNLSGGAQHRLRGAQGPKGDTGATGATRATGAQGIQGVMGAQGAQGLQGLQGLPGPQGDQGLQGVAGAQGVAGPQGAQGLAGSQGGQGVAGAQGVAGPQGLKGDTGAQGPQGPQGDTGPQGPAGPAGASGFAGAFYSVQDYTETVGVGAIATAACDPNDATNSQNYVAISGGVQDTDSGTSMIANDNQVAVAASFPGRMDFNTWTPKPYRLDGWIVQFAHVGAQDTNLAVWALCVPVSDFGGSIPVHVNS